MTAEWATLVVSVVVILSVALGNAIGAGINNKRMGELSDRINKQFANFGERLARLETRMNLPPWKELP